MTITEDVRRGSKRSELRLFVLMLEKEMSRLVPRRERIDFLKAKIDEKKADIAGHRNVYKK